jgi:hypothetical protein
MWRRLLAWLGQTLGARRRITLDDELNHADLTHKLLTLRHAGWGRPVARGLVMEALPLPEGMPLEERITVGLDTLYAHARRHTTFAVPRARPRVVIWPGADIVGRFEVDSSGACSVVVGPIGAEDPRALATILAHEACHHILGMSNLRGKHTADNERLTDAAMFMCGFGKLYEEGRVHVSHPGFEAHLGYLSAAEVRFAQRWVEEQL